MLLNNFPALASWKKRGSMVHTNSKDALIIFIFAEQVGVPHRRSAATSFRYVSL